MVFFMYSSVALQFLALFAAVSLFIWALRHEGKGVLLAKIVSSIAALLILIGMAGTVCFSVEYWKSGHFAGPLPMQMKLMGSPMINKPVIGQSRVGAAPSAMPAPGSKLILPKGLVPPPTKPSTE